MTEVTQPAKYEGLSDDLGIVKGKLSYYHYVAKEVFRQK